MRLSLRSLLLDSRLGWRLRSRQRRAVDCASYAATNPGRLMAIEPHPHGRIFTAAAGLGNAPVPDDWSFERERIYFASRSTKISRGSHLFVLGAGRKGAVL